MYKATLVGRRIDEGRDLLRELLKRKFPVADAFWWHDPETIRWRLYIVSRVVEKHGPLKAYGDIQRALRSLRPQDLSLNNISVIGPRETDLEEIRRAAVYRTLPLEGEPARDATVEDVVEYVWKGDGKVRRNG